MKFSIGSDLVEIQRIRGVLSRHPQRFMHKIFTHVERSYCLKRKDPAAHFAARFAAKEAIVKAMGSGFRAGIDWLDIEISNDAHGKPTVTFSPALQQKISAQEFEISITHSKEYAMAVAIWQRGGVEPSLQKTCCKTTIGDAGKSPEVNTMPCCCTPLSQERAERASNGLFLIILAILFYTGAWWPGILFAIAIVYTVRQFLLKNLFRTLLGVTAVGILVFFSFSDRLFSFFFPAVLILIGLYLLGSALFKPKHDSTSAPS